MSLTVQERDRIKAVMVAEITHGLVDEFCKAKAGDEERLAQAYARGENLDLRCFERDAQDNIEWRS